MGRATNALHQIGIAKIKGFELQSDFISRCSFDVKIDHIKSSCMTKPIDFEFLTY